MDEKPTSARPRHGVAGGPMSTGDGAAPAAPPPPRPALLSGPVPQLALATVCGAYVLGAAFGWGSPQLAAVMGDFGLTAAAWLATASCLWFARTRTGTLRPAWVLLGASSAMTGLGSAIWGWYEVVLQEPVPRTSVADLCYLLFAPLAIVGLLMLAKRPLTRTGWFCFGLDAWLVAGSLLTLTWSVALVHTAEGQGESVARMALALGYPLLDIALVSMLLVLHFRRGPEHRSAVNMAVGGLAVTVLCDALFSSPMLREHYSSGQLLDAGWFAGSLLLALAPWVSGRPGEDDRPGGRATADAAAPAGPATGLPLTSLPALAPLTPLTALDPSGDPDSGADPAAGEGPAGARGEEAPDRLGSFASLMPYLAAAVCFLSILLTYNTGGGQPDPVVVVTATTVVVALLARQGITLMENLKLTRELSRQENHFRSLVQGSSDVIMISAQDGRLRYVSPAAAGVYGRDPDRLIGKPFHSLIHPDDADRVLYELCRFLAAAPDAEPATRIECRIRHGGPEERWMHIESTVNRHPTGLIFNSRDVTDRVRLQEQLRHSASHDPLTDLPNRALFTERVETALAQGPVAGGEIAVLFIDLDGFKAVNDSIGHQAGDELLIRAARRLRDAVRQGDLTARLGGDEFAALITGDPGAGPAGREQRLREIAERVRAALSRPYQLREGEVRVAASIGVAFAEPGSTPATLMRDADLAMYRAKQAGKARVEFYTPHLRTEAVRRTQLAARLRAALHTGELTLLHQPVVGLDDGRITALSAQARWRSAHSPLPTPLEHLRGRREYGPPLTRPADPHGAERGTDVSRWLLEQAVAEAARRRAAGHSLPVAVRLPAGRLTDRPFGAGGVEALLAQHELPPESLLLELPEAAPVLASPELRRRLSDLGRLGVGVALDGFGGTATPPAALLRLPVDLVRLDRELTDGLLESPALRTVTGALLRLTGDLGVPTLADGIDHPDLAATLRALGCTHAQGPLFSEPLEPARLHRLLEGGRLPVPGAAGAPAAGPAAELATVPAPRLHGHGDPTAAGPTPSPVAPT